MTHLREGWHGDHRRAAAAIVHYTRGDGAGIHAILTEAVDAGRVTELFVALLAVYAFLLPELRTEQALAYIAAAVERLAAEETTP